MLLVQVCLRAHSRLAVAAAFAGEGQVDEAARLVNRCAHGVYMSQEGVCLWVHGVCEPGVCVRPCVHGGVRGRVVVVVVEFGEGGGGEWTRPSAWSTGVCC